jgi:hypothetical protein
MFSKGTDIFSISSGFIPSSPYRNYITVSLEVLTVASYFT